VLKKIKQTSLGVLQQTGLFNVVSHSRWRRDRLLIMAYHGISLADEHVWDGGLFLSPDCFQERLRLLKKSGCNVLPLAEAIERMYARDLPEKAVVLTVDDGNYDFYRNAYPLIKEFNWPVTVYLTTYYVDYNRPIFDVMCSYLLWKGRGATLKLKALTGEDASVTLATHEARAQAWRSIKDLTEQRKLSAEEKDALAATLAGELKIDYDALCTARILHRMNVDEVRSLAAGGVDVQLHTHRHRVPLERELMRREIEDNRERIRELTGHVANHLCYPSGVYDPVVLPWLRELGVVSATTCDLGLATASSDPLLLPRFLDSSTLSSIEFEGWLVGLSSFLPRR
jgi:peptidoglycan/xylan/chitin deacetylase (PgdA/CDA1 family)